MIKVLFGTESGNSEMAADDIAQYIRDNGESAQVIPMEDCDVSDLAATGFAIVITSTYGEGELPETTKPFHDALAEIRPDLSALKFAAFGLGDSTYETYGNGIDVVSGLLRNLGAQQIGDTGRHDAAKGLALSQVAVDWVSKYLPELGRRAA
ncbi:nitric oxide synthase [Mesorhizobium sp. Root102]|uniref:flavodoxin domain-containing protein n=1 Tax=Mesorhizobium sp. Root102 TaxID=1736422 RepID=UPI0006F80B65|nr:flavodoxin domain-containing protein [Mesorhizobium sp. Root102]KQU92776.1 nitric oxide synthase [Mesorhizobium sp. Root102]